MAVTTPTAAQSFDPDLSCPQCFGTISKHDTTCEIQEAIDKGTLTGNHAKEIEQWGYSPSAVEAIMGKTLKRKSQATFSDEPKSKKWTTCRQCNYEILNNEEFIQIARYKRVGSNARCINFHTECWIEVAGKTFLP
jgi:hypothetical protein